MADDQWISILPEVLDLLRNKADRIVDDTSIEKLLAWIKDVCSTPSGLAMFLKQETGALTFLRSEKLVDESPCCIGVSFAMRLCGILWSKDYALKDSSVFIDLFTKSRANESLWSEAIVRNGYLTGLQSLTLSNEGQRWLHTHQGCLLTAVNCISDRSMFVALAAREFIARFLIANWSINTPHILQDKEVFSTSPGEMEWLFKVLQDKLGLGVQTTNDAKQQAIIRDNRVSVLDIVRILLNTNFEVGQEILCVSKLFSECVSMAGEADQTVCRKLVDVINGMKMNSRSGDVLDWCKLLSGDSFLHLGDKQTQSVPEILLKIPMKWYKRGLLSPALSLISGLSFPKDKVARGLPSAWPEFLACLINAPMAALMEKHMDIDMNGVAETDDSDIDSLTAGMLSLNNDELEKIERVKTQIQKFIEPWILTKNRQIDAILQTLYTIKVLINKEASSYSQHVIQWVAFSLKILRNAAMVTNEDWQKPLALDVKGNVKVIKTTVSVIAVLLKELLMQSSVTDSTKRQYFHALSTLIIVARSSRTDPTVTTSTLECLGVLLEQGSFLILSTSTDFKDVGFPANDPTDMFPHYQRTMENLGSLVHLRLRDQRWEVKDSALELVARLIKTNLVFSDYVLKPSILSLVWESVDESESYVRASAWCCIGHLACDPGMWATLKEKEHLTELAVFKKMEHVLIHESEAFPRRSVMDCLVKWSREHHPIAPAISTIAARRIEIWGPTELNLVTNSELRSVFAEIIKHAFKDFDWEVKIRALELVKTIIQGFSDSRDHVQEEASSTESCPSQQSQLQTTADKHCTTNDLLALLVDMGAVVPLLEAVLDCDSPVCEKALKVISTLKGLTDTRNENQYGVLHDNYQHKLAGINQPIETQEQLRGIMDTFKVPCVETCNVVLCCIDVTSLTTQCTSADITVQTDPAGFLQDILAAATNHGDNLLDCY